MQHDVKSAFGFEYFSDFKFHSKFGRRKKLLYFSGSLLPKTAPFRQTFKKVCDELSSCSFLISTRRKLNSTQMLHNFQQFTFCAVLGGDTRASKRFFDAITSGCIPVTFDPLLMLPFMQTIPYEHFVVRRPFIQNSENVRETISLLENISDEKIIAMQKQMKHYVSCLSYLSKTRPNAVDMIMDRLYHHGESFHAPNLGQASLIHKDWKRLKRNLYDSGCAYSSCTQTIVS